MLQIRARQNQVSEAARALAADMPDDTARIVRADEGLSVWVKRAGSLREFPVLETIDLRTTGASTVPAVVR